jgi:hypothetical protein
MVAEYVYAIRELVPRNRGGRRLSDATNGNLLSLPG